MKKKKLFKIEMTTEDDKYANVKFSVDASGQDIANMFHAVVERHEELIPFILTGITAHISESEDVTLN